MRGIGFLVEKDASSPDGYFCRHHAHTICPLSTLHGGHARDGHVPLLGTAGRLSGGCQETVFPALRGGTEAQGRVRRPSTIGSSGLCISSGCVVIDKAWNPEDSLRLDSWE